MIIITGTGDFQALFQGLLSEIVIVNGQPYGVPIIKLTNDSSVSSTSSGGTTNVTISGIIGEDEGAVIGTGTVLNFVGDNISLSISGTILRIEHTNPFDNIGFMAYDDASAIGTGTSVSFGNNLSAVRSGTVLFIDSTATGGGGAAGVVGQDEGVVLGTGTIINVTGDDISFSLSGTVLTLNHTNPVIVFPQSQIGIYGKDEGGDVGTGTILNIVGDNISLSISGTTLLLEHTNPVIVFPQEVIGIYGQDEATGLGTGSTLNVVGDNIGLSISGTVLTLLHTNPTPSTLAHTHSGTSDGGTVLQVDIDIYRFGFVASYDGSQETTISFDGTNTFTLAPTSSKWSYYRNGIKYTITGNKTVTLSGTPPASKGLYYIYIDATDGSLTASTVGWTLEDTKVPVVTVAWDDSLTPKYWLSDERHTVAIDRRSHWEHHFSDGTQVVTPAVLSGYQVAQVSPVDSDNTFGISSPVISDDDLKHTLGALSDPTGTSSYAVFYRQSGTWNWQFSDAPYLYSVGGNIYYDNNGVMTQISSGDFVNTYLMLTIISGDARFSIIHGQSKFTSLSDANSESFSSLTKTGLPISEYVAVYRLTWGMNNSYGTKGKCRLAQTPFAISVAASGGGASVGLTWGNIVGVLSNQTDLQAQLDGKMATGISTLVGYDEGVVVGSGTILNVVGDNISLSSSGTFLTISHTNPAFPAEQIGIYAQDEAVPVGTGTVLNVVGTDISISLSGTVLTLLHTNPVITFSQEVIGIYGQDEAIGLGTGSILNVVGSDISLSISGSVLTLLHTNPTITFPQEVIGIYGQDEASGLGTGTTLNVTGAGASMSLSGTILTLNVPGGGVDQIGMYAKKNGSNLQTGTILDLGVGLNAGITGTTVFIHPFDGGGHGQIWIYNTGSANSASWVDRDYNIQFFLGDGQNVVSTGSLSAGYGYVEVPADSIIESWSIFANATGSCTVNILKSTYAGFPPTSPLAGLGQPILSNQRKNTGNATGTASVSQNDILLLEVSSASTIKNTTVSLRARKVSVL